MRNIIYSIIAISFLGIFAMGFTYKANSKKIITIQTVDKSVTTNLLNESAKIISARLKSYCSEKFEMIVAPENNQISVKLNNNWDIKIAEKLILQKGVLAFYESFNQSELIALLGNNKHLFTLLESDTTNKFTANIGCTSISNFINVLYYLKTTNTDTKCKFLWSKTENKNEICLYVGRIKSASGDLLGIDNIECIDSQKDKTYNNYQIEIKFKQSSIEKWANLTKYNLEKTIILALDNDVLFAPIVKSEIKGGNCIVTGNFTKKDGDYIVAISTNGILPCEFKVIE